MSSPVLVGREGELSRLQSALEEVRSGAPTSVLMGGEAGIGKTRLVAEFTRDLDDVHVLHGGCLDLGESSLPFAPLVESLRGLARAIGEDRMRRLLIGARGELRRLIPDLARADDEPVTSAADVAVLYEGTLSLLEQLASERPVVLVLEDLHWASRSTLDLLSFLLRNLTQVRVLVLATFRSDELPRRDALRPVVVELSRLPNVERLELPPLTEEHLVRQVAEILGHQPDLALVREIVERAEGNAFYAEELLAASQDGSSHLPATLREILSARLERLSDDGREVLGAAAVAGRRIDHELLEVVADLDRARLRSGLRDAVREELLQVAEDGRHYRFRHALLQEVVYADLLPGERTGLHVRFADALQARPDLAVDGADSVDAELARHATVARRVDLAFEASLRAAARAREVFAFDAAQAHLEQALDLEPSVGDAVREAAPSRVDLLEDAARMAVLADDADRGRAHLLGALRAQGLTSDRRAELLTTLARTEFDRGRPDDALTRADEALALDGLSVPVRAMALVLRAHMLAAGLGRAAEAVVSARDALASVEAIDAAVEQMHATHTLGVVLAMSRQDVGRGLELLRASIEMARDLDDHDMVLRGYTNLGATLVLDQMDNEQATAVNREGVVYGEQIGWASPQFDFLRLNLAHGLLEAGDLEGADRQLEQVTRRLEVALVARHLGMAVPLRVHQGRVDDAARIVEHMRDVAVRARQPQFQELVALVDGLVPFAQGRPALAHEALAVVEEMHLSHLHSGLLELAARVAVEASSTPGSGVDAAAARSRIDRLATRLEDVVLDAEQDSGVHGAVRATRQVLVAERARLDGPTPPGLWEEALRAHEHGGMPSFLGHQYLRIRLAEALLGADRRDEAAAVLSEAHADLRQRGARWLAELAEAVARRGRIELEGSEEAGDDPFGLTPREREVLALVSLGLTNREIGERLFIADKTASVHVSNILSKLSASTRGEAALVAHRHGLDGEAGRS